MKIYTPLFILSLIFLLRFLFLKFKFLLSNTGDHHQNFITNKNVPLIGGLLIFLSFMLIFKDNLTLILICFLISIFLLGVFSDMKLVASANKRLIFQCIITFIFFYLSDLKLSETGIKILDELNNFYLFNYLFVSFCLIILINGSNFIDGLNGLCLGYYLLIIYFILEINFNFSLFYGDENLIIFASSLCVILFYNFLSKIFIGDNGSYIIAVLLGIILIQLYNENNSISSFYIVLLLWYPCFELLFSMLRKYRLKISVIEPDNDHLHHLIFYFFMKKYNLKNLTANNLTSLIILAFNFILFNIASANIYNSNKQCALILSSIFIYIVLYYKFDYWKKNYSKKNNKSI